MPNLNTQPIQLYRWERQLYIYIYTHLKSYGRVIKVFSEPIRADVIKLWTHTHTYTYMYTCILHTCMHITVCKVWVWNSFKYQYPPADQSYK